MKDKVLAIIASVTAVGLLGICLYNPSIINSSKVGTVIGSLARRK